MKTLTSVCILCLLLACSENKLSRVDFLIGTWKMEGKEQYENWELSNNKDLIGYSYKIKDSQKIITETLSIKILRKTVIFEATVPDQNEGRTIPFTLNNEIKDYLSFENIDHDFPKKIQYKRLNNNEIEVTVLGDEGEGFSYKQLKQRTK
ncbi:DUF6265 family protein [uncultured Muriicola sp.]|uniref:DUF6265 family protein n=1 Tax=uncultured Muriicola sp. TaxID=1583102 RepID=UPI0026355BB4|nr:DUF6265 family protein [uncultured Muriicola sp.]